MKISENFNLKKSQYELDFVDIDINTDIPLFLDPFFISKCDFPFAIQAHRSLQSFFDILLFMLKENKISKAQELFSHLGESNEICLGFSRNRPQGKGLGPSDADKIFKSLRKSKAIETGVMEDIEDVRIFVSNIDKDKMSDMTANIIKKQLINYTQAQCKLWNIPLTSGVTSGYYWNRTTKMWENDYTEMLVADGRKVLLVPKRIVSYSREYTPQKYLQHFILNFLQHEQLRLNGPLIQYRKDKKCTPYVTKKSVRENIEKESPIDKNWIVKFTSDHPDIFCNFREKSKKKDYLINNDVLTHENILEICNHLIVYLESISPGSEMATIYHRAAVGILELLFYPQLCSPIIEQEIHQGRKRIDITFDNCSENGFFARLSSIHNIPSTFVVVECKNYSRDIANPELDQISGRFSINRGKVGLLVCRSMNDKNLFIKRCQDTYKDSRGLILPLVDDDLIQMLREYPKKKNAGVEEYIQGLFHNIACS